MHTGILKFSLILFALSIVAGRSSADEFFDERIAPKFDDRQWTAVHADASKDEVIVEYALQGESAENWTELVTTGLLPVKPDSGILPFVRDFYQKNITRQCPFASWEQILESDSLLLCVWHLEACLGPDSTEYTLVAFRRGIEGTHFYTYAARDRKVFKKQLPIWKKLFREAAVFRPAPIADRLSSELLADTSRMIHIAYRYRSTAFDDTSYSGQTREFWRAGTKYFRGEEPPDSAGQVHGLIITNEPDAWLINRMDNTGRHLVDPGPTFNTVCPVFGELRQDGLSALEFGKEVAFFEHHGARQLDDEKVGNIDCHVFELPRLYWVLRLYVNEKTGLPSRISRRSPDGSWLSVDFEDYQIGLPVEYDLFKPEETVKIEEG